MQTDVRKCSNCGGRMVFQNNQWVCMSCGSSFAVDWESDDVERIRQATEKDRADAEKERLQTLNTTSRQIQEAEQRNRNLRESQLNRRKRFKPIITVFSVMAVIGIINFVMNLAMTGLLFGGVFGKNGGTAFGSSRGATLKEISRAISADQDLQKKLLSSAKYYAKYDGKEEIELSDPEEIATRCGEPELIESYLQQTSSDKRLILVYKTTYQTQSGERTQEVFSAYTIMLSGTLDENGHVESSFAATRTYDEKYIWRIAGYESLEDLHKDNRLDVRKNASMLLEFDFSANGNEKQKING